MFTKNLLSRTVTIVSVFVLALSSISPAFAVGTNDNFANATQITSLPYSVNNDNYGATFEAGEPTPTCGYGYNASTIWYSYTPDTNTSLTARATYNYLPPVLAIYTGSFGNLTQIACGSYWSSQLTFQAQAGVTYYFQLDSYYPWNQGNIPFSLQVTPPPQVYINVSPYDPSIFDNAWFNAGIYDPIGVYGNTYAWTVDGTTSNQSSFYHQFAADGDYPASLTFTTYDGRSVTTNQVIHVITKDVAISKFGIPQTAKVNQTKTINVDVQNKRYSDYVQVAFYKGTPGGGDQLIGTLTLYVPAQPNQSTTFKFSYTFTCDDASIGKVTFKAIATIANGRDALPADNTAISTTSVNGTGCDVSYP